jgi:hypothetical protein
MNRNEGLLGSYLIAGFEGSSHRRHDGRRLDLVSATQHDRHAARDYARMQKLGFRAAREALRWHLDEPEPGHFTFDAERSRIEAAARHDVTVAWDLCHFGWPDHVDPFDAAFPARFAEFAEAAASVVVSEGDPPYWFAPMNEISFLTWAGGEVGVMNPFAVGRGAELKRQLVRAAIGAMRSIRTVAPHARFLHPEPLINVATDPDLPHERSHAVSAHDAQFEAWDMLSGLVAPELGGGPSFLDVPGANYYPDNQWIMNGGTLAIGDPNRVTLHEMLAALHKRYGKAFIISETGTEDGARATWLQSVLQDVTHARERGVPVGGVCLYPILNHPGWADDRHCHNGLWDYPGPRGGRVAYRPMVRVLGGAPWPSMPSR